MRRVLFALNAAGGLAGRIASLLDCELGTVERRQFPDGESYIRLSTPVANRHVLVLCSLDRPDTKALPLLFVADAARQQGAERVGLIAPYLAYMRQDKSFSSGEAVTSQTFARLIDSHFDWLVTADPHLHRYPNLGALYSRPALATSAAEPIADWIRTNVQRPVVIGPDEESAQWVERIATLIDVPWSVFRKERRGDFDVSLSAAGVDLADEATPVLVDDIASSARTMIEAVRTLRNAGRRAPYCVVVHAIFAGDAFEQLQLMEPAGVVSTNAVAHGTNQIDISGPLAAGVREMLAGSRRRDVSRADSKRE